MLYIKKSGEADLNHRPKDHCKELRVVVPILTNNLLVFRHAESADPHRRTIYHRYA